MSEDWDFYSARVDDEPALIYLDLGIAPDVPVAGFGALGYLCVLMRYPRPDGLPSDQEFDDLIALENSVVANVTAGDVARYVGCSTSGKIRDLYFYARDGAQFERLAADSMKTFPAYKFEVGSREDAQWELYRDFLYPSAIDIQRIKNRRVCEQLQQHGDSLSEPRLINHCVYFENVDAIDSFAKFARESGFEVRMLDESDRSDGSNGVEVSRHDSPADIDEVVILLLEKSLELGGEYDGWGCNVVS